MLKLDVSNFRIIRKATLHDDSKLSLVIGYNEDGKSSLCGAIQYAITGQAFGLRGDSASALVTHGEDRMHVRVQVGDRLFNRTRTGGDPIKGNAERLGVAADVLPMLFNQKLVGDGGSRHMKAFLAGCASERFDPRVAFQNDPEMLSMVKQANTAGALSTKQVIAYCERLRAASQAPPSPVAPSVPYPSNDELTLVQNRVAALTTEAAKVSGEVKELEGIVEAVRRILAHFPAVDNWNRIKEQAATGDPLGARRAALRAVSAVDVRSVEAIADTMDAAGHTVTADQARTLAASVTGAIALAKAELAKFPPPPTVPAPPVLSAADRDLATALGITTVATATAVLNSAVSDLALLRNENTRLSTEQTTAADRLRVLNESVGAWKAYETSLPNHETAVLRARAEWDRWNAAAKRIEAAEREYSQTVGNSFADMVGELSGIILQGRKITIDLENGIRIGNDPIELLSESTRWRAEVATLAAIAVNVKCPLLVIDGADILDDRNKTVFQQFLLERIAPHFEHVLLTATCKGRIEDEKPSPVQGITKWLIRAGELTKLTA